MPKLIILKSCILLHSMTTLKSYFVKQKVTGSRTFAQLIQKNGAKAAIKICTNLLKIRCTNLFKISCTNPFLKLANCFIKEQNLIWQFLRAKMNSVAFSIIPLNQINQDSGLSFWTFFNHSQL